MLIVQKYGGTSLAGPEEVRRAALRIASAAARGDRGLAVLSAQGDATDALISDAERYSPSPPPRERDMLLATGEQASAALMAMALSELGVEAVSLTGWQAGMETDAVFGGAHIRRVDAARLRRELESGRVALVAGFQGVTRRGDITTLGRGGSDTTAVALAAALRADRCLIYTDVEGVYTADPRLVPGARKLPMVDTDEMLRLAAMGAQVLHERSVALAKRYRVPLEVLSSRENVPGTRIEPVPLPVGEGRLTALARSGPLVTLVGSGLRSLPFDPGRRAALALERAGLCSSAYLQTDACLSVRTEPEESLPVLRCLHQEFFE